MKARPKKKPAKPRRPTIKQLRQVEAERDHILDRAVTAEQELGKQKDLVATLTRQRDDAIHQLNLMANSAKIFKEYLKTLEEVDKAMRAIRGTARKWNRITATLAEIGEDR
jgi:hypothetical protein